MGPLLIDFVFFGRASGIDSSVLFIIMRINHSENKNTDDFELNIPPNMSLKESNKITTFLRKQREKNTTKMK